MKFDKDLIFYLALQWANDNIDKIERLTQFYERNLDRL